MTATRDATKTASCTGSFPCLVLAAALAAGTASGDAAPDPSRRPRLVVVELLTSEGCSSCPPAEALLARLVKEGPRTRVLEFSEHVDCGDGPGWRAGVRSGRMKIIALERPVQGAADESFTPELLRDEATRAWELYQSGAIRELYFRADREQAVLVLEAADVAAGRRVLAQLPLVREGLIDFELVPLAAYPGFARLFQR